MLEKEEWHDHNQRDMLVDIQSWNTGGPRTSSASNSSYCNDQAHDDEITRSDQILVGQSNARRNFR